MTTVNEDIVTDLRLTIAKHSNVLEHIRTSKRPLERPPERPSSKMPSRRATEDWVVSLRTYIKTQLDKDVGTNWQIREGKVKVRLGIRFEDGTRTYKYLPYKWERINHGNIQDFIKQVHYLHIEKKIPINEAFERVKTAQAKPETPTKPSDPHLLMLAWSEYKKYLVPNKVQPSNWINEYQGKFEWRLRQVSHAQSAKELFLAIGQVKNQFGKTQKAGSNARTRTMNAMKAFLEWGVSEDSNYLLPEAFTPPSSVEKYIGRKSGQATAKEKAPKVTLTDKELEELLASLRLDHQHGPTREKAKEWDFCLRLCIAYGLRPAEASHRYLSIKKDNDNKDYIYCSYVKRTKKGNSPAGRLWNFDGKEQEWNLISRLKNQDPLPDLIRYKFQKDEKGKSVVKDGLKQIHLDDDGEKVWEEAAGDRFKNYLGRNPVWKKLVEENPGLVPYAFRHTFSKNAHNKGFPVPEVAKMMRHSPSVHLDNYSDFVTEKNLEESIKRKKSQ